MHKYVHHKTDGRRLFLYGHKPNKLTPLPDAEQGVAQGSHARWHPLRREWVVYAVHRQTRTFLPPKEFCPLCPSRPDGLPTDIPFENFEIAVFQNRWPSLSPRAGEAPRDLPVLTREANGDCEVVVFTPEHNGSLGTISQERRELLVRVWADRYHELYSRPEIQYVMPFENRGELIGVTMHHPHGQIYAYPFVPPVAEREAGSFRESPALLNLLDSAKPYTVLEDQHCLAMIPPFARFPYEVLVYPKKFHPGPWTFSDDEVKSFAFMLGEVVRRYDKLFEQPFPYILLLHAAPKGEEARFHFHAEFNAYLRTKDKLKYLAGTEVGAGTFAVDALPEETAKVLREVRP